MSKIKLAVLRLKRAPCGFGNSDGVHSGRLHHFKVGIDSVVRHIFVIIGGAE